MKTSGKFCGAVVGLSVGWAIAAGASADTLPIIDTHVHYSEPAWAMMTPAQVVDLLERSLVPKALVSSSPDDGTMALYEQDKARIIPFRGEYYSIVPGSPSLCRNLIYPVPDPAFPFLGVHFTRTISGTVEAGPNAVLALAREGYTWLDFNIRDTFDTWTYPGFLRLALRNWRTGAAEMWRSLSKRAFVRALQRLVPALKSSHLQPAPAGVRAQAVRPDGSMVDDFLIERTPRLLHVCNAPSPAATASLLIGATLAAELE